MKVEITLRKGREEEMMKEGACKAMNTGRGRKGTEEEGKEERKDKRKKR